MSKRTLVTGRPTEAKDKIACYETVLTALAAYDDKHANAYLKESGKWSAFDEPGAACAARTALERFK